MPVRAAPAPEQDGGDRRVFVNGKSETEASSSCAAREVLSATAEDEEATPMSLGQFLAAIGSLVLALPAIIGA